MIQRFLGFFLVVCACGPKGDATAGDASTGAASETDGATEPTAPTDGATEPTAPTEGTANPSDPTAPSAPMDTTNTTGCETAGCEPAGFGYICLEFERGETADGDLFVGTDKIAATLHYGECLRDYYVNKHPEMRIDGPADAGGAVFEEWRTRLCSEAVDSRIDCTVESFNQILAEDAMVFSLSVIYRDIDPSQLAGGKLLWGPGPLPGSAECEGDEEPSARMIGLSDVTGLDAGGNVVWRLESFGPTPTGVIGGDCLAAPVTNG